MNGRYGTHQSSRSRPADPEKFTSAATHIMVAGALGVVGALIMGFTGGWGFAALVGWDVMAAVFVAVDLADHLAARPAIDGEPRGPRRSGSTGR